MQPKVTIRDVAAKAGITPATVSRALSGKDRISPATREAVLRIAAELGYEANFHAQRLRADHASSRIVALFSGLDLGVGTRKVERIQRGLTERGYDVPIHAFGFGRPGVTADPSSLLHSLRRQKPRAIVVGYGRELVPEAVAALRRYQEEGGTVACYGEPTDLACDHVLFDTEHSATLAVRHLIGQGHRDIGFCAHGHLPPHGAGLNGFRRAMTKAGLAVQPEWLLHGGIDGVYEHGGAALAEDFLRLARRPTALVIVNDVSAATFVNEAQRAGVRVPADVSVVGHDDAPAARYCAMPLTTITHPVEEIADSIVELLCRRLDGQEDGPPRQIVIQGELVARASTAPPLLAAPVRHPAPSQERKV